MLLFQILISLLVRAARDGLLRLVENFCVPPRHLPSPCPLRHNSSRCAVVPSDGVVGSEGGTAVTRWAGTLDVPDRWCDIAGRPM